MSIVTPAVGSKLECTSRCKMLEHGSGADMDHMYLTIRYNSVKLTHTYPRGQYSPYVHTPLTILAHIAHVYQPHSPMWLTHAYASPQHGLRVPCYPKTQLRSHLYTI